MERKIEKELANPFKWGYYLNMKTSEQTTTTRETTMSNKTTTQIAKALKHLKAAAEIFGTMENQAHADRKWAEAGTATHYRIEIETMISSDNGESGLEAYLKILAAR
jgi:hypothetical protein